MSQCDVDFSSNPALSHEEKEAWVDYQGYGFEDIAKLLYEGELSLEIKYKSKGKENGYISSAIDSIRHTIQILDNSFKHISLYENHSVFHGLGRNEYREINKLKIGDIFQPSSYFSVSCSLNVAKQFSVIVSGRSQIVGMKLKKGQSALYLGNFPLNEDEIVLPRNSNLHLLDKRNIIINNPQVKVVGSLDQHITLYTVDWVND